MRRRRTELCLTACLLVLVGLLSLDFGTSERAPRPQARDVLPELRVRSASAVVLPQPQVRVAVADGTSVTVEIGSPFRVESFGAASEKAVKNVLWKSSAVLPTRASCTAKGIRLGNREWSVSAVEIIPESSPAIWVNDHQYRGRVRLHRVSGKLRAVNVLPLEEYVAAVVDGEMPAAFPVEARKAQAIVARTFAVYQKEAVETDSLAELTATVKSQKYLGYQYRSAGRRLAGESESSRQAARETAGQVCTLNGSPFCTYYCAVCGGRTMLGSEIFDDAAPVLKSVECAHCREARLYRWQVELSRAELESDLKRFLATRGDVLGKFKSLLPAVAPRDGLLPMFTVRDDKRAFGLTGVELRQALAARGVSSPRFTVVERKGKYALSGQGHGHGAGLCQWGARGLAQQGRTAPEIVLYYYPGAAIQTLR